MRYLENENPYIWARFTTGDVVGITIYKTSDDSVVINAVPMTELASTGYFKYQFNPSITELTEYFYIATNIIEEHAGKIILGGYPDSIKDQTDKMNFVGDDIKSTLDGEEVTTDSTSRNASKANISALASETTVLEIKANQEIRTGTITDTTPSNTEFNTDLTEGVDNFWNRAAVKVTSGQNEGVIRKVQNYETLNGVIRLRTALPYTPVQNDTFTIIPLRCFRVNFDDVTKIVDDIWDEAIAGHTVDTTFGGKNQKVVPSETIDDYKNAMDEGELHSGLDSYGNKDNYKANVSGIPTNPLLTTDGRLNNLDATVSSRAKESGGVLDNIKVETDKIKYILGLTQENFKLYDCVYVDKKLTQGKIKIYPSALDLTNDTNIIATYQSDATYDGDGLCTNYEVKKI